MASQLPPELLNMVFDELLLIEGTNFMRTFCTCSLVCQAWTFPAQRRIFAKISLDVRIDKPSGLLRLLDDSPHIARFVRTLTLFLDDDDSHTIIMGPLVEQMKDLLELKLTCLEPLEEDSEWHRTLLTSFMLIRALNIDRSVLKFDLFTAVLQNHPHIETLTLDSPSWWDDYDDSSSAQSLPLQATTLGTGALPKLRNISVTGHGINSMFFDWMILHQCTRNIEEAVFVDVSVSEAPSLGRLINDIGPALKRLTIQEFQGIHTVEVAQEVARCISLANCTALHKLEFVDKYTIKTDLEWVLGILAGVASTEIETIEIRIDSWGSYRILGNLSLDRLNLSRMDDILMRTTFRTLRKVYLEMPGSYWHPGDVVSRLGGINGRDILEVKYLFMVPSFLT